MKTSHRVPGGPSQAVRILALTGPLLFALSGCAVEGDALYPSESGGNSATGGTTADSGTGGSGPSGPGWDVIGPTMVAKCGGCHGSPPSLGAPFPLMAYADGVAHADRSLKRIEQGTMPPPNRGDEAYTAQETDLLRAWIAAGTPEVGAPAMPDGGVGDAAAAGPTWADVEAIYAAKCNDCHGSPPSQGAPYPLDTYDNAVAHADRSLKRIQSGSMPPPNRGFEQVTADEEALISAWIDAGHPR